MSERVSVHVSIYEHDAARFCEIYGEEPEMTRPIGPNGWIEMDFGPIAGAGEDERREAATRGIRFFGYHWACDDHPAAIFCSTGDGELYSWLAMRVYDEGVKPVSVWELDKDKLEPYAEPHNYVIDAFQEIYRAAWKPAEEKDERDFGEHLEALLDCMDNEAIIQEMALHDPENVGLVLDYIRVRFQRQLHPVEEDARGWLGLLDDDTLKKIQHATENFLNNMKPMTTNPAHTASAAHVGAIIETILKS